MDSSASSRTDNASSSQLRRGGHANTATATRSSKSSGLLTRVKTFFKRMSGGSKPSKGAVAPSRPQQVNEEAKVDRETIE